MTNKRRLPTLPPEVLAHIFRIGHGMLTRSSPRGDMALDSEDLWRLTCVSKEFRPIAESQLWHDIELYTVKQATRWAASPAQGRQIPHSIVIGGWFWDPRPTILWDPSFRERCRGVKKLRFLCVSGLSPTWLAHSALSGLKDLHFDLDTFHLVASSLPPLPFRLTALHVQNGDLSKTNPTANRIDSLLGALLAASADTLQKLSISVRTPQDCTLTRFWPQLPLVASSLHTLSLGSNNFQEIFEHPLPHLHSFTSLSTLTLIIGGRWLPAEQDLVEMFSRLPPSLRNLELGGTDDSTLITRSFLASLSQSSLSGLKRVHFELYTLRNGPPPRLLDLRASVRRECLTRGIRYGDEPNDRFVAY